jgi:hypothetical protein
MSNSTHAEQMQPLSMQASFAYAASADACIVGEHL